MEKVFLSLLNPPFHIMAPYQIFLTGSVHTRKQSACVKFYQILIFSPNDSPSKTTKNVFYFI